MNNASNHSVKKVPVPTLSRKKNDIIQWLESNGVVIDKPMVKFQLIAKVNEIKPMYEKYVIDKEALKTELYSVCLLITASEIL